MELKKYAFISDNQLIVTTIEDYSETFGEDGVYFQFSYPIAHVHELHTNKTIDQHLTGGSEDTQYDESTIDAALKEVDRRNAAGQILEFEDEELTPLELYAKLMDHKSQKEKPSKVTAIYPGCPIPKESSTSKHVDISLYKWIKERRLNGNITPNPEFPKNYIDAIRGFEQDAEIKNIYTSGAIDNVKLLLEHNIDFKVIMPKKENKLRFLEKAILNDAASTDLKQLVLDWDNDINYLKYDLPSHIKTTII